MSLVNNRKQGNGGGHSGWLNMGLSSGLTLQMDLIVSRNLIFCHSAGTLCPLWGPTAASGGPYQQHSGCGIEELSSASNQTMRGNERGRTELRSGRVWRLEERGLLENSPYASTPPLRSKPHTFIRLCVHLFQRCKLCA